MPVWHLTIAADGRQTLFPSDGQRHAGVHALDTSPERSAYSSRSSTATRTWTCSASANGPAGSLAPSCSACAPWRPRRSTRRAEGLRAPAALPAIGGHLGRPPGRLA